TTQISRLNSLINELLEASMIDAGRLVIRKKRFNLDSLLEQTINDLQFTTNKHKIIKVGKIRKKILGDEIRIQEVLINLLTNAIKYSPNANKIIVSLI